VILADLISEVPNFVEILGLGEEPLGMYYSPMEPAEGFSPRQAILPSPGRRSWGRSTGKRPWGTSPASSMGDVRPDGEPLPGIVPDQTDLGHGAQEDRPKPQGVERDLSKNTGVLRGRSLTALFLN
jgi:hypothetical protein